MRRIAIINQKGGVGKTTTAVNLGAALARLGRRVVVIDMDPQANASMNLGAELEPEEASTYTILTQGGCVADTLRGTSTPGLSILPAHLDLSGAELELASAIGRETILRDALDDWEREEVERSGRAPADVVLIDNPPSLGLLSVNGLAASKEVLIAVQTEFFALQGLSKLVEIVQLLRRRMNPELEITSVLACLYDSRLRLAREVLGELRAHFPNQLFRRAIAQNVKLAETPSFARTIFEYAPESKGADDYLAVAREFLEREGVDPSEPGRSIEPKRGAADDQVDDATAAAEVQAAEAARTEATTPQPAEEAGDEGTEPGAEDLTPEPTSGADVPRTPDAETPSVDVAAHEPSAPRESAAAPSLADVEVVPAPRPAVDAVEPTPASDAPGPDVTATEERAFRGTPEAPLAPSDRGVSGMASPESIAPHGAAPAGAAAPTSAAATATLDAPVAESSSAAPAVETPPLGEEVEAPAVEAPAEESLAVESLAAGARIEDAPIVDVAVEAEATDAVPAKSSDAAQPEADLGSATPEGVAEQPAADVAPVGDLSKSTPDAEALENPASGDVEIEPPAAQETTPPEPPRRTPVRIARSDRGEERVSPPARG